jgi:hypothetical protein
MIQKRLRPDSDNEEQNNPRATKVTKHADPVNEVMSRLSRLLSFEQTSTPENILSRFASVADILLRNVHLQVTSFSPTAASSPEMLDSYVTTTYELLEIEFYLWMAGSHEDPFTHGTEEQRHSGRWYVHLIGCGYC